jgi:hypothetical protein
LRETQKGDERMQNMQKKIPKAANSRDGKPTENTNRRNFTIHTCIDRLWGSIQFNLSEKKRTESQHFGTILGDHMPFHKSDPFVVSGIVAHSRDSGSIREILLEKRSSG